MASTPDGASLTLATLGENEAFGLSPAFLQLKPIDGMHIVADDAGVLLLAPASHFIAATQENREFAHQVALHFARHAARMTSRMYDLVAFDVRARLQVELLRLCERRSSPSHWIIQPAPTHAALGAMIGATREAVSRQLRDMEGEGLIESRRGMIQIIDPTRLEQLVGADRDGLFLKPHC